MLYKKFLNLSPATLEEYKQLIDLVYEKAVMEPHFAPMYAKLCRMMNRDFANYLQPKLHAVKDEASGTFYCVVEGTTGHLVDGAPSEEAAREEALKQHSFRRILADKCQRVEMRRESEA